MRLDRRLHRIFTNDSWNIHIKVIIYLVRRVKQEVRQNDAAGAVFRRCNGYMPELLAGIRGRSDVTGI